jgi:hypothetical protein
MCKLLSTNSQLQTVNPFLKAVEKGLKKDELALEKLAGAKVKQQQMLGNYKPLMQILKKSRRCIPIKYNLEELTDTKKYLENFSADAYL